MHLRSTSSARSPHLAVFVCVAGLLSCYPDSGSRESEGQPGGRRDGGPAAIPAVEVVQARTGVLPLEERISGVVKARNQVAIHPEISASIAEVLVRSGDAVESGQPLIRLHDDELREQLRQAEAAVRLAEAAAAEARARVAQLEAQVRRTRALAAEELVSTLQLESEEAQLLALEASADQAEARVEQSWATADERRSALAKTVVRAPVAGRIGTRYAEVGMLADRSTVLFVLGNFDRVRIEIPLTEGMLAFIEEGQPVRISAASLGTEPLAGTLARISPFLTEGSFSTIGEIDVRNPQGRLKPGMFVVVDVLYGQSERATLLPTSALWQDPDTERLGVYVAPSFDVRPTAADGARELSADAHPVELRAVEVLAEGRSTVGLRGVEEGEWVVVVGQHMLREAERKEARMRPTSWEHILQLQGLQKESMLREFLDKQQRMARTMGAEVPPLEQMPRGPRSAKQPSATL